MTHFAAWPSGAARFVLILTMALVVYGAIPHAQHVDYFGRPPQWRDWMLYQRIEERVMAGENYYRAAVAEHRLHRYPTTPPQVFREPTLTWVLALLRTDPVRRAALFGLSLVTLFALWFALQRARIGLARRVAALILAGGGVGLAWTPISFYSHEIWSGLLIALSLSVYAFGWRRMSVALGLLACLFRELSLIYFLVMAAFALQKRNWREAGDWILGIAVFALLFAGHLMMATKLHVPGDLTFTSAGWFHFGGWPFVVDASRQNLFLLFAPRTVASIWITLAILGLVGARDPWLSRVALVVGTYMALMLFVGLPGNAYWGFLYAPLLPIGLVLAPQSLRDLISKAVPGISALQWASTRVDRPHTTSKLESNHAA